MVRGKDQGGLVSDARTLSCLGILSDPYEISKSGEVSFQRGVYWGILDVMSSARHNLLHSIPLYFSSSGIVDAVRSSTRYRNYRQIDRAGSL